MAGSSSAAARMPFGRLGDAAQLKRFASAFGLSPRPVIAGREIFDPLYGKLPARFPPLFEQLVTGFAWEEETDLGPLRLLANPPGSDLSGLEAAIFRDSGLIEALRPAGLLLFALGPDGASDPVCFDSERRRSDRDCPIVLVRLREAAEVAEEIFPSFRALIERLAG
ncbi:MAG TPA: hypothetical protein VL025_05925 [Thermoanaerobaculia bacterium]|nr:hypothetical protein [Thermoanaerobaculia bacterium]